MHYIIFLIHSTAALWASGSAFAFVRTPFVGQKTKLLDASRYTAALKYGIVKSSPVS